MDQCLEGYTKLIGGDNKAMVSTVLQPVRLDQCACQCACVIGQMPVILECVVCVHVCVRVTSNQRSSIVGFCAHACVRVCMLMDVDEGHICKWDKHVGLYVFTKRVWVNEI